MSGARKTIKLQFRGVCSGQDVPPQIGVYVDGVPHERDKLNVHVSPPVPHATPEALLLSLPSNTQGRPGRRDSCWRSSDSNATAEGMVPVRNEQPREDDGLHWACTWLAGQPMLPGQRMHGAGVWLKAPRWLVGGGVDRKVAQRVRQVHVVLLCVVLCRAVLWCRDETSIVTWGGGSLLKHKKT